MLVREIVIRYPRKVGGGVGFGAKLSGFPAIDLGIGPCVNC